MASRLATHSGRIEFTFVTDWTFTFRCTPPLAATQFLFATGSNFNLLNGTRTRFPLVKPDAETASGLPRLIDKRKGARAQRRHEERDFVILLWRPCVLAFGPPCGRDSEVATALG